MHLKSVSILIHPTAKTPTMTQKGFHVVAIFICFHCLPKRLKELGFLLSNIGNKLCLINKVISLDALMIALDLMILLSG